MALAYLCRQLERSALAGKISVTAFVVDHRARAESSQEARTVAGWLHAMGKCYALYHFPLSFVRYKEPVPTQS